MNPKALVPVLTHGDLLLTESLAIVNYLDNFSKQHKLLPQDPKLRARVDEMVFFFWTDVYRSEIDFSHLHFCKANYFLLKNV